LGTPWPPSPLIRWWIHAGRAPEAERVVRDALSACAADPGCPGKQQEINLRILLLECVVAQGRFREARGLGADFVPPELRPYMTVQTRQWWAASAQDMPALETATRELEGFPAFRNRDGGNWLEAPKSAIITALAGRLDLAAPVARMVTEGGAQRGPVSGERDGLAAIVASADSGPGETPPLVVAIASHPQVFWRYPGTVLLGHHLRSRGDCRGAIAAYEAARAVPWHPLIGERPIFHPFVLHSLALCYEQASDPSKARERNDEMLRLWADADPDLPLLIEAKAMRERLAAAGGSVK
jgi:hypothetical protein